jgi:hypothetical protein
MKSIYILALLFLLFPACEKTALKSENKGNGNILLLNDTSGVSLHDCIYNRQNNFYICMEAVNSDSRCPVGANCIWEGNAEVKFRLEKSGNINIPFILNTNTRFINSTIVEGYRITLTGLNPHPAINVRIDPEKYYSRILVQKE